MRSLRTMVIGRPRPPPYIGAMMRSVRSCIAVLAAFLALGTAFCSPAGAQSLPPPVGPESPRIEAIEDDGHYRQTWFNVSFLDLREDFNEAKAEGKRFAVFFEQQGCIYCKRMHTDVLSRKYINDYVRENFRVLQLNLWGAREVTDFDGKRMTEKDLAERWGVIFTPTVVFFKDDLTGLERKWGRPLEATERLPLGFGADTFYDLFVWVRHKIYERDRNFQRFHIARYNERDVLKAAKGN
jgi:thioredoxin-related protein